MMQEHFREALEALDVPLLRKMWKHVRPNLPQPASDDECLIVAHMARTRMENMPFRVRAYSHSWLVERALPSQLPDRMRPRAQRLYPVVVPAVGICVTHRWPISLEIRRAMEVAALDAGTKDSPLTKRAIMSARKKARKQLLGIVE